MQKMEHGAGGKRFNVCEKGEQPGDWKEALV